MTGFYHVCSPFRRKAILQRDSAKQRRGASPLWRETMYHQQSKFRHLSGMKLEDMLKIEDQKVQCRICPMGTSTKCSYRPCPRLFQCFKRLPLRLRRRRHLKRDILYENLRFFLLHNKLTQYTLLEKKQAPVPYGYVGPVLPSPTMQTLTKVTTLGYEILSILVVE